MPKKVIGWDDDAERVAWETVGTRSVDLAARAQELIDEHEHDNAVRTLLGQIEEVVDAIEFVLPKLVGDAADIRAVLHSLGERLNSL